MRITIWLFIAVFVSTLYWPQLLNYSGIFACVLSACIFLHWQRWRYLALIPLTAAYFSTYILISLLGVSADINPDISVIKNVGGQSTDHGLLDSSIEKSKISFLSNALIDQDNTIIVQIRSLINDKNSGYFIANITSINNITCVVCPIIEMRWFKPLIEVQAGQVHRFKVRLKPLRGKGNPDGFDRQKWRYSEHIAYIATIRDHLETIDSSITLRAHLYQNMLQATHHMRQQGAILALVFADKSLISYQDKQRIKQLGIAHLFAISGLHIGLLFLFSFVIFNALSKALLPIQFLGWTSWRLINIASFIICLGYGYISGFSLPTQRALLMLFVSLLMLSSKRKIGMFDLLVLCLWSLLVLDPLAILSSSLWLSFTAMSSILLFIWCVKKDDTNEITHDEEYTNAKDKQDDRNKQKKSWETKLLIYLTELIWLKKVGDFIKWLLLLQILLTIFMLPIQLLNFSAISVFSLFINLIAIPLFSWFIIPLALLATLLLLIIEPVAVFLLALSDRILVQFLSTFDGLTAGYILLSESEINIVLSFCVFLFLMSILIYLTRFFTLNKGGISIIGLSFLLFLIVRVIEIDAESHSSWQIEVFDIGQGLAILIKSNGQYLLYDTGPSYPPNYAVAEMEILPYLQARGIQHLDYLIISHSDNDHAGGASIIEQSLEIKSAYAGEASIMNKGDVVYQQCLAGQTFQLGKLNVEILSPTTVGKNNNNNSCVIKISDGSHRLLLTGDINKTVEHKLVKRSLHSENLDLLKADILIAPHHGSATSSTVEFINQVDPRWVVFAAGYKNRWHFPKQKIVQRYQHQGIKQLTTGETGFIRFNVQNQHIDVKTYREDLAAYWYHQHLVF